MSITLLKGLPDDVLYKILCFINPPNTIVTTVCQSIVPLCHATKSFIDDNETLWESILGGYYLCREDNSHGEKNGKVSSSSTSSPSSSSVSTQHSTSGNRRSRASSTNTNIVYRARTQRRSSKRLRRTTAKEDVIHAHLVLRDQVR